jgi:hypothetical protein
MVEKRILFDRDGFGNGYIGLRIDVGLAKGAIEGATAVELNE